MLGQLHQIHLRQGLLQTKFVNFQEKIFSPLPYKSLKQQFIWQNKANDAIRFCLYVSFPKKVKEGIPDSLNNISMMGF